MIIYTIRNEKVRIISAYQALIKIWLAEKLTQEKLLQSCLVFGKTRDARVLHVVCAPKEEYLFVITTYCPDSKQWDELLQKRKR